MCGPGPKPFCPGIQALLGKSDLNWQRVTDENALVGRARERTSGLGERGSLICFILDVYKFSNTELHLLALLRVAKVVE